MILWPIWNYFPCGDVCGSDVSRLVEGVQEWEEMEVGDEDVAAQPGSY